MEAKIYPDLALYPAHLAWILVLSKFSFESSDALFPLHDLELETSLNLLVPR